MKEEGVHKKIIDCLVPYIGKWAKDKKKIIIGIEGSSGSGKSALSYSLNKIFKKSIRLSTDLYIKKEKDLFLRCKKSKNAFDFFTKEYFDFKLLKKHLVKFKNAKKGDSLIFYVYGKKYKVDLTKQILFLDGVFLCHDREFSKLIDKKIFLVLDLKEIKIRRNLRVVQPGSKNKGINIAKRFDIAWKKYLELKMADKKSNIILNIKVLH